LADRERRPFTHLLVRDRAEDREFRRRGGGDPKIRDVEYRAHGGARLGELTDTLESVDAQRDQESLSDDELRALGAVVVLEAEEAAFPLKLDSLQKMTTHKVSRRPQWLLLSVTPAVETQPEQAVVWISDQYRERFLRLFEDYLAKSTEAGNPRNRALVANIGRIRQAVLKDLWQSAGQPPTANRHWWELWLHPSDDGIKLAEAYAEARGAQIADRTLHLDDRTVIWINATWDDLQALPFTSVPLAEIRRPEFVDTIEDLPSDEQDELAEDLLSRITTAGSGAPVICHLDTGVRRSHALLAGSLAETDLHTIVGTSTADHQNHGTQMAGLALYGPLEGLLLGSAPVALRHRLESVKILPDAGTGHDPLTYGVATANAVALPEAVAIRKRTFCMPITAEPDRPGEPTLWSASVDALAAGVDIARSDGGIALLSAPDPDAARLFVISAGNVNHQDLQADYRAACDISTIEDPAQAWNALTVGAHTELASTPSDPSFAGWTALAQDGDISPHSRTSVPFSHRTWPIKPDICMEGGNVLTDGASDFHGDHPLLSLRTTDAEHDLAISSTNATSAATAQAARLAALTQATYPSYWPETVRALLVHAADWTPTMRAEVDSATSKGQKLALLRRYGWGVPTESAVLASAQNAVTLVSQDEFVPFEGENYAARRFRLHRLPWPEETLRELQSANVVLKATLSYFIEPTASRRGWRSRYSYASHALRFELKAPTETPNEFLKRVNQEASAEEEGQSRPTSESGRWLVGKNQRNLGSLHQDIWEGSAAELADCGLIAVHPIGGWWKYNKRKDRMDKPVRYALLVSLATTEQDIDLYTPIATELAIPIETAIPGS
jgi:hypothetical protein